MSVIEQSRPVGRRRGPAPFGYEWQGGHLAPIPREQAIRWLILHLHTEGFSLRKISAELDRLRIPTRAGLRTWPRQTLHRIVTGPEDLTGPG